MKNIMRPIESPIVLEQISLGSADCFAQAECDENLCGTKLTPTERAVFTRRRKEAYEAKHPETRRGVAGANVTNGVANDKLSFAEDTSQKTGVDKRTVERDARRGEKVAKPVLDAIRGTDLDKGVVLDRLAAKPKTAQAAEIEKIKAEKAAPKPPKSKTPPPPVSVAKADTLAEVLEASTVEEMLGMGIADDEAERRHQDRLTVVGRVAGELQEEAASAAKFDSRYAAKVHAEPQDDAAIWLVNTLREHQLDELLQHLDLSGHKALAREIRKLCPVPGRLH